ncbi:DNA repair protein RAD50 [Nematocida sp. ERTm5]|nr:DNA repair protein RAD50 [Nematocida sp. ERTm5]
MSVIGKLKIKGIRSFTEEYPAAIEMQTPLTLIVGHNGTGKTTIVEALKYATTGALPPNSKNGAFVHDPRVSQERETKAQIMMKFKSCEGKEYIVVRGMSQTIGKTKRETKTVESVLWQVTESGKRMICNKLSEVDCEVPILLGSTPSVLENVIFVHQEESTWPLGDPSVVKKKMDGIFSSMKFIKAIDALTALRKEKTGELKVLECKYENLQQKTQHKHIIEQRIARITERLLVVRKLSQVSNERIRKFQIDLKESQKKYENALSEVREKEKAESELAGLSTKELLSGSVVELQSILPNTCVEDAEELRHEASILEIEMNEIVEKIRKFEDLKVTIEESRVEIENLNGEKKKNLGLILEKVQNNREYLDKACTVISDIIIEIKSTDKDLSTDRTISLITEQIENLHKETKEFNINHVLLDTPIEAEALVDHEVCQMESVRVWIEKLEEILDRRIQEKDITVRTVTEEIGILKEKQRSIIIRSNEIRSILDVDVNEQDTSFISEIQESENIINSNYTKTEYNKNKVFMEIEELQQKLEICMKETEKRKEKEFLIEEIKRKEKELEFLPYPSEIKLSSGLPGIIECEDALIKKITVLDTKIKEIQTNQQKYIHNKMVSESKHMANKLLQQAKVEQSKILIDRISGELISNGSIITRSEVLQKIKEGCSINLHTEFQDVLYELYEEWGSISASEKIYEEFLSRAEDGCPFCKSFISTGISKGHVQKIKNILECIKNKKEELKEELTIEKENTKFKQEQAKIRILLNNLSSLFILENIKAEDEVEDTHTVEEWIILLDTLNKQLRSIKSIKNKYEEIEILKSRENKINLISDSYGTISEKYKEKLEELQRIEKLEQKEQEKYIEFENRKNELRTRIKEIENRIEQRSKYKKESVSLEKEYSLLESEKSKITILLQEKTELTRKITENERIYYKTKELLKDIKIPNNNLMIINSIKERFCEIFTKIEILSKKKYTENHKNTENSLKQELIEVEEKRNIINNRITAVMAIHTQKQLIKDSIRAAILSEKVKECISTQDTLNHIQEEIEKLEECIMKEQKIISECVGEEYNLEKQKEEDESDVKIHCTAESDELSAYIMIKVLKESISDLEKYIKSVQAAIVRYHSEKLAEVNAIIKEIWGLAYKGTDIDEIKIVSHLDKTYSLVMVKNGIEIDMRGRVSAGQKVLASIVIRLALAEAFSLNCGFLSLDEPTTNLDSANISGLAKALSSIIQARKAEGGFQLLVITHDEDFVRELLATECTEYFYRLERDIVGVPKIVQVSIYDL